MNKGQFAANLLHQPLVLNWSGVIQTDVLIVILEHPDCLGQAQSVSSSKVAVHTHQNQKFGGLYYCGGTFRMNKNS